MAQFAPVSRRHPRRRIHPDLLTRVEQARRSGRTLATLAAVAGFLHYPDFSAAINRGHVLVTAKYTQRLERLAKALGHPEADIFTGDEFIDEQDTNVG
jgi:hypothetical protein